MKRLIHISRRFGTTYRHAMGMWVDDQHPKSVDYFSLCRKIKGAVYVGVDDPDKFVRQFRPFYPDETPSTVWPDCPQCANTYRQLQAQGDIPGDE